MKTNHCQCRCISPPSPELEKKIRNTKKSLLKEAGYKDIDDVDILDLKTYTLISTRPRKTRAHDFQAAAAQAPSTGTKRAIVLLVDFSDEVANTVQNHYNDMLFKSGATPPSMRDYYSEVSYGKLDVTGDVAGQGAQGSGWFRAPKAKSFYTNGDFGFGTYPNNAQKCVEDAIDLANPVLNFSQYDNDGNGSIEALIVICAGTGGEQSGNVNDFWSHKWNINPKTVDGVKINRYFMAPENGKVGVMAHELGHLLCGLPDLYDTDSTSRGTGQWDLMAGGSWNNGGDTPAHPTAWCKVKCGWVTPTVIFNGAQKVTIRPYDVNEDIFKLPIGNANSNEYFLLSNRRKSRFDAHLPGEGLIIEHIDESRTNNSNEDHYLVDIEQADGNRDLNLNTNSGDSTDPFPTSSNSAFTDTSSPNSKDYNGNPSKVEVKNIQRSGANITASVSVGSVATTTGWILNKKVLRTFASSDSMNAWANIDSLGWKRIDPVSPDGVTNTFSLLNDAFVGGRMVNVKIGGDMIQMAYVL